MTNINICVNSFGLGRYLHNGADTVWDGLRAAGVTGIEPCVAFRPIPTFVRVLKNGLFDGVFSKAKAPALIDGLRNQGFEVYSFHLQNTPFTLREMKKALLFTQENALDFCVYSFMSGSTEKIRSRAPVIREAAALFRAGGKELLIHNHDMEWRQNGGTCVMRWLLENVPEIRFELDLGWTQYAGVDAVGLLREFPDRFPLLHIKEIAVGATAHTGKPFCTAPGEGILLLEQLIDEAKRMPLGPRSLIIDQDDSIRGDIVGDVAKGIVNIRRLCDTKNQQQE